MTAPDHGGSKRVELTNYLVFPTCLGPVCSETESGGCMRGVREMDMRYHKLAQAGTRNINDYMPAWKAREMVKRKNFQLVVFIDSWQIMMRHR